MIITNSGDGSNGVHWVLDQAVLDKMEEMADDGDECYASGDGLQVTELTFPDESFLREWVKQNGLCLTTMNDIE